MPQDHFQLDGDSRGTAQMYFMLHRARQASQAKGFLWVHFGGPGFEVASNLQERIQAGYFPDEILDHFHLIGLDPRGTGQSAFAADLQKCTHKQACDLSQLDFSPLISTAQFVHDMDVLRKHLGAHQINILAYSYGSQVGALYANYFPKHLRALVLDSPAAPQTMFKAMLLAINDAKARQDLWLLEKTGLAQNATMQKLFDLEADPNAHATQHDFDVLAWARNYQRHPDWAQIIRIWRQHATFGYQFISEPALTPAVFRTITRILDAEIDSILNSATANAAQKTQMLRFVVRFWFGLDADQAKAYSAWLPAQAPTLLAEVRLINASFALTLCNDFPEFEPAQHLYDIDGLADLCQGWRRQSALQRREAKMSAQVLIVGNALDARTPKYGHDAFASQWPHAYRIEVDSSIEHGATFQGQRWLDPEEPLGLDALASTFLLHAETPEQIPWPEESSKHLAFAPLQKDVGAISNRANASHAYWQQIKANWIEMRSRLRFLVTALENAEIE